MDTNKPKTETNTTKTDETKVENTAKNTDNTKLIPEQNVTNVKKEVQVSSKHEIKVTKDGRAYLCSPYCMDVTEFNNKYASELTNPAVEKRLNEIGEMTDIHAKETAIKDLADAIDFGKDTGFLTSTFDPNALANLTGGANPLPLPTLQAMIKRLKLDGIDATKRNDIANGVTGRELKLLEENFGTYALSQILAGKTSVQHIQDYVKNLQDRTGDSLTRQGDVDHNTLILDSNFIIPIRQLLNGMSWSHINPVDQRAINLLRQQRGLPPLTTYNPTIKNLESILGPGPIDIKSPNVVIAETPFRHSETYRDGTTKTTVSGTGQTELSNNVETLKLDYDRFSDEYQQVMNEFVVNDIPPNYSQFVGGKKGDPDRAVVTDVFLAKVKHGETANFYTSDRNLYSVLAMRFHEDNPNLGSYKKPTNQNTPYYKAIQALQNDPVNPVISPRDVQIVQKMLEMSGEDYFIAKVKINSAGDTRSVKIYPIINI